MSNNREANNNVKRGRAGKEAKPPRRRHTVLWIILGVVVLLLAIGGFEAYRILYKPQNLFNPSTINPSALATPNGTPLPTPEPEGTPDAAATPDSSPTPVPTPGITESKDIVNILLIGIDRRQNASGTDAKNANASEGTDPHADVMMVVAVNFKEKRVDLVSLLRDTLIYEPNLMPGVYKLNASFNVGGGFNDTKAGFRKACDAAQYLLGGVPVDYYYAVDFDALVKLVDAIGGVDFDVESASYSKEHVKGMQHMNGSDVLYYVRNRKKGPEVHDAARVDRQKELMIAIFNQLKGNGKLSMVPDLIGAANNGVYTNTNLEQTLALVNFARTIDPKNIGMHSMPEKYCPGAIGYMWYFIEDQAGRQNLIKQIYGVDVPPLVHCTEKFTHWLDSYGFTGMVYLRTAKPVLDYAETQKANFTDEQQKAYDALAADYAATQAAWDLASLTFKDTDTRVMLNAEKKMKTDTTALAKLLDYQETIKWTYDTYPSAWVKEPKINQILVDPR